MLPHLRNFFGLAQQVKLGTSYLLTCILSSLQSSSSSSDEGIEYYDGNLALPIFKSGLKGNSFSVVDVTQHLLFTERDDVVCSTIPTNIQDDVVFLVDNTSFENVDDLKSDDLGVWRANKVASDHCHVYG